MSEMRERFYVTELHGYLTHGGVDPSRSRAHPGVTYTVHDRAFNCRAVAAFRSEQYMAQGKTWARLGAEDECRERNAAHEREVASANKGTGA